MSTHDDSERTKSYITEAVFLLMKEKQYDKINVTDIAKKAGIGRVTFYRHFTSKDDVIVKYFQKETASLISFIPKSQKTKDDYYEVIFTVFHFLREKKDVIQLIINAGLEMLYLDFLNEQFLLRFERSAAVEKSYSAYYAAGCLFNVSLQWIKNDCRESVKHITDT